MNLKENEKLTRIKLYNYEEKKVAINVSRIKSKN